MIFFSSYVPRQLRGDMHDTSCINLVQARLEAVSLLAVLLTVENSLPPSTDFSSVNAFKRPISSVDFSQLLVFML